MIPFSIRPLVFVLLLGACDCSRPSPTRLVEDANMPTANRTSEVLGPKAEWSRVRVELYAADFLDPKSFNVVIWGSGRVEAQVLEYQIEHRYRFDVGPDEVVKLFDALGAADPMSLGARPQVGEMATHSREAPFAIVVQTSDGARFVVEAPRKDPPPAFQRSREALAAVGDPLRRKVEPAWSRGPIPVFKPFPEWP